MGLWEYIEWDIDEEKERNRKNAEKILRSFPDVGGLKEVLDDVQSLMDSEVYGRMYKASEMDPEEMSSYLESADELLKLRQVKLASEILKDPPLYVASLTGVIIFSHFKATFGGLIPEIDSAYVQRKLNHKDTLREHAILERLMSLLDDFDKPKDYPAPDEEFYQKLKKIKWDKQGKKLFKKIDRIRGDIGVVRWVSDSSTFETGENYSLTFLAACNAVNHTRDKILAEDVVVAYKTYLKLLNTDISKLM
ncbi:MAG: hypothetical protein PQ975_02195 [Methanobacterium sp.]|jgi:hypothetical protein